LDDVKTFFYSFYAPNNAILVISGNIDLETTKELSEKWFGPIPAREINRLQYQVEPQQTEKRIEHVYNDVPLDLIIMGYHICERMHPDYYAVDLMTDVLGGGKSARLFNDLLKKQKLFSEIDCYQSGDYDAGLVIVEGKLIKGVTLKEAEEAIEKVINELVEGGITETELEKVKNKSETNIRFNDMGVLNKAMKLAYAAYYGDIELANTEVSEYLKVSAQDIQRVAKTYLKSTNCNVLYYHAKHESTK
jgi:predicted Zn-dependent peptidase